MAPSSTRTAQWLAVPVLLTLVLAVLVPLLLPARAHASGSGPVLVIAAHPDDETLGSAGVIESALRAGRQVYVAVVTNGALSQGELAPPTCGAADGAPSGTAKLALTRDGETRTALAQLETVAPGSLPSSHIFFLGYPDSSLATLAAEGTFSDPTGLNATFAADSDGTDATCNGDYHFLWAGVHAPLTGTSLAADLDHLIAAVAPTDIYTHAVFEGHTDHATVGKQVIAAVARYGQHVTVHETLIHPKGNTTCQAVSANWWPNPPGTPTSDPTLRSTPGEDFTAPPVFTTGNTPSACPSSSSDVPAGTDWGPLGAPTEVVPVPADMQPADLSTNLKWQAISKYDSQLGCDPLEPSCGYLHGFVKADEIFWREEVGPSLAPVPTGWPAPNGDGRVVGKQLFGSNGSWANAAPTSYAYQWLRCDVAGSGDSCVPIPGATTVNHTLVSDDAGHTLRLRVTATNAFGSASVLGDPSDVILQLPTSTAQPSLTTSDGQTFATSTGTWSAYPDATFTYEWESSTTATGPWATIAGATDPTYRVHTSDIGLFLRAVVTATNSVGSGFTTSPASAKIVGAAPSGPVPAVSGSTAVGATLTATAGTWSGTLPLTLGYQWQSSADGATGWTNITGATAATYTIDPSLAHRYLRVAVSGTNSLGTTVMRSVATARVTGIAPSSTAAPTVSGPAAVGSVLTATTGTWNGTGPIAFTYQWQSSPDGTTGWADIAGATASTYTVVSADVGRALRVRVTATNADGTQAATSAATGIVAAPPAASGGGGGGGGGSSARPPDLQTTISASPETVVVGGTVTYTVTVSEIAGGSATGIVLTVGLPAQVSVISTSVDRGQGCTGTGTLTCSLDWLSANMVAHVVIVAHVEAAGAIGATASVTAREPDVNPLDNSVTLSKTVEGATAPFAPPPPAAKPSITIVAVSTRPSGVALVRVKIQGWTINPRHPASSPANAGYWVILVDGKRNATSRLRTTGSTTKLAPGRHRITVELVRETGRSLSPAIRSKPVTISIAKPKR